MYFLNTLVFVSYYLVFCCSISANVIDGECNFDVRLLHGLRNDGFHVNMTYGIVFNTDNEHGRWLYQECIVALDQVLPPAVYANPDELRELGRLQKVNAVVRNKVNIELAAEDSEPINVYVIGKVTASKVYLWVPIHIRYHRARLGGSTIPIRIPRPKIFLRCPDQRLDACGKTLRLSTFLCNGSSKEKCSWKQIPYSSITEQEQLTHEVPVGNLNHYYIVTTGTAAIIFIGSVYIMHTIHNYKMNERRKKKY